MATQSPTENTKFKVIIVGGSISGLTLAHCLHQANIDHVVLEKKEEISPQQGAFIGVWPNGARILDQLGLYTDMEKLTAPLHKMNICYPDGHSFSSALPKIIHDRFGYPIVSLDRQKVLEILYDKYPAKSNVLVKKRVAEVQLFDDGGRVITDDGAVYDGHLIVGADGIHSRIRSEMWRLADARSPNIISPRDKKSMTVEYACVFGISSPIPGLLTGEHVNSYSNGSCVITFHGKDGRVFWFIIEKLSQKFLYPNTPRYSASDAADFCDRHASVRVWKNIHVADLWKNKLCASMTALEEGMLETWSFDRIVLFGDSIHKMTPNIGQGANTAMEDAAILASLLNRMLDSNSGANCPKSRDIQNLLQEFQALRYNRVKDVCSRSWFGARLHTRDDFLKAFIGRYIFPYISGNLVTARTSMAIAGGQLIDYLPSPKRSGVGWVEYAANGQPKAYQHRWTLVCISSFLFCSLLYLCRVSLIPALPIVV